MNHANSISEQILNLERELLTAQVRTSPEQLERYLRNDFIEFGSSGKIYDKEQVITALKSESSRIITLSEFDIRLLAPGVVQATYTTLERSAHPESAKRALRSSIWIFDQDRWQMIFHQGTPTG